MRSLGGTPQRPQVRALHNRVDIIVACPGRLADLIGQGHCHLGDVEVKEKLFKALDAFPARILAILGGKDKGSDYTALQQPLREKAILALLIGAAAEKIESQITGAVGIERAKTLERAVEIASHAAQPGDGGQRAVPVYSRQHQ